MTAMPARRAAITPAGESSMTIVSRGSTPMRFRGEEKKIRRGLAFSHLFGTEDMIAEQGREPGDIKRQRNTLRR